MIDYTHSLAGIGPEDLRGFFVGWPNPPSPETHLEILKGSQLVALACTPSGRVVGFATALTDGVLSAYIPLLEVVPEFRGRGIGARLVEGLMERTRALYMVDLLCDAELQPWYQNLGFRPATGMMRRNYDAQSGAGREAAS